MKTNYFVYIKRVWAVMLFSLMFGYAANATVWVARDSAQLAALLPVAGNPLVASGDTIELPDGAVFNAINVNGNAYLFVTSKKITIRAATGSVTRPKIVAKTGAFRLIQIVTTAYTESSLILENVELDGKLIGSGTSASSGIYTGGGTYNIKKVECKNVYFHHFARSGIEIQNSNNILDSLIINNCRFFGGGGINSIYFNSNAICKNAIIVNSTFNDVNAGIIRAGGESFFKKSITFDHCTFDSIYNTTTSATFNIGSSNTGIGGSSFLISNCIFNRIINTSTGNTWGFPSNVTTAMVNSRYGRITLKNFLSGLGTYGDVSNNAPSFMDTLNSNLIINDPTLLGAGNDGKTIGDQRWGAAFDTFNLASPAVVGIVNSFNNTITLNVPAGTDLTSLTPIFKTSTGASVKVGGVTQVSGTTSNNFTNTVIYSVTGADGYVQDWYVKTNQKGFTSFKFNTPLRSGMLNSTQRTINIKVSPGTDVTALVASYTYIGDSIKIGTTLQTSGTTANNFASPVVYTIYKNGTSEDWTVTLANHAGFSAFSVNSTPASTVVIDSINNKINLTVPFGTDVTNLIATYTTKGDSAKIGSVLQTSATTANNFSTPLIYDVYKGGIIFQSWTVTVNKNVALTAFMLRSQVSATIDPVNKTVNVIMPTGLPVSSCIAIYNAQAAGVSVAVGGTPQTSGVTANNFTSPVSYVFTPPSGPAETWTVTASATGRVLTFFNLNDQIISSPKTNPFNYNDTSISVAIRANTTNWSKNATFVIPSNYKDTVGTTDQISGTTNNTYTPGTPLIHKISDGYNIERWKITPRIFGFRWFYFRGIGENSVFNEIDTAITIRVPYSTDVTNLIPDFELYCDSVMVGSVKKSNGANEDGSAYSFASTVTYDCWRTIAAVKTLILKIKVTVIKDAPKTIASLQYLVPSNGKMNIPFSPTVYNYNVVLAKGTTTVPTFTTIVTTGSGATVNVNNAADLSGTTTITVTAEDGVTTQNYNVTFSVIPWDVTVTSTGGGAGCTASASPVTVANGGSTTLTAAEGIGYELLRWQSGATSLSTALSFSLTNIISDTAIVAVFKDASKLSVSVSTSGGGTVSATPDLVFPHQNSQIKAVPNAGYNFVKWTIGSGADFTGNTNATIDIIDVTKDTLFIAVFAIKQYTFTAVAGANGSITGTLSQTVNHGASASALTAVPSTGYHFVNWTKTGTTTEIATTAALTLANIISDTSVTANFAINTYTITATAGANGSITGTLSQTVNYGANGTELVAVPAAGYHFLNWTTTGTSTVVSNSKALTLTNVTANKTVTANFEVNIYTVAAAIAPAKGGTISGIPTTKVVHGNIITLTAKPGNGYNFVNWTKGATVLGTDVALPITVTQDTAVTANFAIKTYTLTVTYTPTAGGSITGIPAAKVDYGTNIVLKASPAKGYSFTGWKSGSTSVGSSLVLSLNVTKDTAITASFAVKTYSITATVASNGGGTITGVPAAAVDSGQSVTLTAVPSNAYRFAFWSENGVSISEDAAYTIIAKAPYAFVANFEVHNVKNSVADAALSKISVYPVPANDVLNIESENVIESISIIDMSGRIVFAEKVKSSALQLNTSAWQKGLYNAIITTSNGTIIRKIQVLR